MNPKNKKLSEADCQCITDLLNKRSITIKEIAARFNVHPSTVCRRCSGRYIAELTPLKTKNRVIKAIQEGYTKAEAAQRYGLTITAVCQFTKNIRGNGRDGNHILRQSGIRLLSRLLTDGCLITDFDYGTARNLQKHFPAILAARYRAKTFYYLNGREKETIEMFFKQMPDHIVNYGAIKEISALLGVKIGREKRETLIKKYQGRHRQFIRSKRLQQRCLEDFYRDDEYPFIWEEPRFKVPPKQGAEATETGL
jgi:hypothetical protein